MLETAALVLLILSGFLGFLAVFFTGFGTFIILLGAVAYAWLTQFQTITLPLLVILLVLYLIGEILEYFLVVMGAKKWGASNWAVVGALAGGILGAASGMAFFGVGIFVGTLVGIFLGAFLVELMIKRDVKGALKAGAGSLLGRVGSIVIKVFIALIMFIIMGMRIFKMPGF